MRELWDKLGCSGVKALEAATIKEVAVLVAEKVWKLVLVLEQAVPAVNFDLLSRQIMDRVQELSSVQVIAIPKNIETCLEEIVTKEWPQIVSLIDGTEHNHLSKATYQIENEHLVIVFKDVTSWTLAIEHEVCNQIEKWLYNSYHMSFLVHARHHVTQESRKNTVITKSPGANIIPSDSFPSRRRKPSRNQAKGGSAPLPISIVDLQEGLNKVVIEGQIVNKKSRQLKNGRQIVCYDITDFSDSITVKRFDEDMFDIGASVKVSGGVRYDSFEKEAVLFADTMETVQPIGRTDDHEIKRVELHLHTTMSTLDGLTHVGDLMKRAAQFGHKALAITDHGSIQAFPEASEEAKKYGIKIIYGVEAYLVDKPKQERSYHVILLATSQEGLINLYRLVSDSYLNNFYRTPRILRKNLAALRKGILVGSACESGEVIKAIIEEKPEIELKKIVDFYDYLEIQPLGNNEFLVRDGIITSPEDLIRINQRVLNLGKESGKLVVGTGDVHFLDPQDEIFRRIIQAGKGFEDAEYQAPLFYRTTAEMLKEFDYLGEDLAWEVVVSNPNIIADQCQEMKPVPEGYYAPILEGAAEKLTQLVWARAYLLYKKPLPREVETRLISEIDAITHHGFSELYLIAYELVRKSNSDGYLVGSRGSVGSSLTAFLAGITEVNPLAPHYRCECGFTEFVKDGSVFCGADLSRANCPDCNRELQRDGFDIPFETFLGFEGDKVPDIDLNFSGDYQSKAHQFVEDLFGKDHVFRAGTISTIGEKTAFGFVKKFEEEAGLRLRRAEIDRLVRGITGVKRTTGQHPGGLMIVPGHMDVHQFTPLQRPADDVRSEVTTTHFEYEALSGALVKLDVLGHDDPTMIKSLEDLTGFKATQISLDEPLTMGLFFGVDSLKLKPEDIRSQVGTYGIPEFNTRFVRQMLEATRPRTFSELVRISGLSHGTNVWLNNAQQLIKDDIAGLNEVIATRDDIMIYLIQKGLNKKEAFKIMEKVRKGKGVSLDEARLMKANNVPQWYIDSCNRIEYMFPKAHAVAYVMMAYRIAYYKVYYPLAFYSSYFSVRAQDFDEVIMIGYEEVRRRLEEIEEEGQQASAKDKNLIPILEVALEMWARGYRFYPVDLYRSDASGFEVVSDGLLVPFSALPGVGITAARNLVESRGEGRFTSLEDLQRRSRVNKSVIEILERSGCLKGLPPTDQLSLFA